MPQKPKLAVILGAGASHDVCPHKDMIKDQACQPPLTKQMFDNPAIRTALGAYNELGPLISFVKADLAMGISLEESLRRHRDSSDPRIQRLMRFLPPALYSFFHRVEQEYARDAANYSVLIRATVCADVHTAFITLNYDTLMEMSLRRIASASFDAVESYVASDWMLVKLHGSVGWGYPWFRSSPPPPLQGILSSNEPLPSIDPESIVVGIRDVHLQKGDTLHYPAIALPADNKGDFVCPPDHVTALVDFLADCRNFLFIGFSAQDKDLLDMCALHLQRPGWGYVVSPDAEQVADLIRQGVPQLRTTGPSAPGIRTFPGKFSTYVIDSEGLNFLVSSILKQN